MRAVVFVLVALSSIILFPGCSSCGQGAARVEEEGDDAAVRTWLSTWDGGSKKLRVRRGVPAMIPDAAPYENP